MKKTIRIISVLCVMAMLLAVVPAASVSASSTPSFPSLWLELESDEVKAGSEFTVDVKICNNPGVWSVAGRLLFDVNVFEYVEYSTEGSVFDLFGLCGYDEYNREDPADDFYTPAYKFNANSQDYFNNVTADGTVVTVTLRAKADAELGRHTLTVIVDEKNVKDYAGNSVSIASSASATFSVVENIAVSTITAADVRLGDSISVKFYAKVDPAHVGAKMRFTMNGNETVVDGYAGEKANEYVYVFEGVAPQCMGDNIKAELVLNGEILDVKEEYSVLEYCKSMLASSASELGFSQAKYSALKTLIADILEYGAKSQVYRNYKTNELVNKGITGASTFTELTTTVKKTNSTQIEGVQFTAAGVYFDSVNAIFVKFTAPGMKDDELRINFNGTFYGLSECQLIDEDSYTYYLVLNGVSALDFGNSYNIIIENYDADFEEWSRVQTLRYSINSYVYSMQNSENGAMADLAKALYNYGASATAYNEAN